MAALPEGHPLAEQRRIALADLASEPWILSSAHQAPGFNARVTTACAQAGFVPQITQHAVQMGTTLGLVAVNLGVALVPGLLIKPRAGVVYRAVKGSGTPIRYEVSAAWRHGEMQPALAAFLATTREVMRGGARGQFR